MKDLIRYSSVVKGLFARDKPEFKIAIHSLAHASSEYDRNYDSYYLDVDDEEVCLDFLRELMQVRYGVDLRKSTVNREKGSYYFTLFVIGDNGSNYMIDISERRNHALLQSYKVQKIGNYEFWYKYVRYKPQARK